MAKQRLKSWMNGSARLLSWKGSRNFPCLCSQNPAIFLCRWEDFILFFCPTHTQIVIFMAVRKQCNVVQEEEEVTGRHSVRGGWGYGLVSDALCSSLETHLHKSEAWIGMAPQEDSAKDYLHDVQRWVTLVNAERILCISSVTSLQKWMSREKTLKKCQWLYCRLDILRPEYLRL